MGRGRAYTRRTPDAEAVLGHRGLLFFYEDISGDAYRLLKPWVMPPRVVKPSNEVLEESPKCVETDAPRLLNDDHHIQR